MENRAQLVQPEARIAIAEVHRELADISNSESKLEHSYARLGALLVNVKRSELWRDETDTLGDKFITIDKFISHLAAKYNKSAATLYDYMGVAEKLLPIISFDNLDKMGISKAKELKRLAGQLSGAIPDAIIETALKDSATTKELRATIFESLNLGPDKRMMGQYFDFGGAILTTDERAEVLEFIRIATGMLTISKAVPDWAKRKEMLLWAMREFTSTHGPEFYGQQNNPDTI